MVLYKDFFGIRPDYAPCMTLADINRTPNTWLGFYPHESFVEILRVLLKSLEGGNRTLWITGAYGTGKSHASLVLQKLFMDDDVRVQKWLELRQEQVPLPVRMALLDQRDKKALVVYDVNSDGVDAKNQFLMRLQKGITRALQEGGHTIPLKGKLDEVIERIEQDEIHFFAMRDKMQAQLSHLHAGIKTAADLGEMLHDKNQEVGLVSDSMRVLEARYIYLGLSAEDFLAWVDSALEMNGLSKIVYIWDEFSYFVDHNRAQLKTLEQLAEASQQGRFFFVPVTHTEISSYLAMGSESAKKANNRFTFRHIDLPNETALKLAADAFVVKPDMAKDWAQDCDLLWRQVKGVAETYMANNKAGIDAIDFKGILPMHPMAAFLLKHLSVAVGANQRSMFGFLNGEEFKTFIEKGGLDVAGHQFLTVDHLWRYFVERDDLGTEKPVQEARAEFARRENELQPDEQRVFKAILLFGLVEKLLGSGHILLSTAVENVKRSFEGDGELSGIDMVLRSLEEKHCFTIVNGRCERFHDRSDTKELEEKRAALSGKFGDLLLRETEAELARQLRGIPYRMRFDIRASEVAALSPSRISKRESFGSSGNRILVQFIFAQDEKDQLHIPDKAKALAKQFKDHRMLFISLPEVSFCRDNAKEWDQFVDNCARLALANDSGTNSVHEAQIKALKKEWYSKINGASKLVVYKPNMNGEPFTQDLTWGELRKTFLVSYAKDTFSAFTDDLSGGNLPAFGTLSGLRSWALAGIEFDKFSKSGAWKTVVSAWQKCGITSEDEWFDMNPNHPLTQIRDFCKRRQDSTVGAGNTCSIRKLYIDLQRPPFGLLGVPHSAMVLGFVLKTWLSGKRKLQWTDEVISKTLDVETLAEIIETVVKDDGNNSIKKEKLICRLSKEEKAFINQSSVIFGNSLLADGTVEAALNAVGTQIQQISGRVPLWVLPDYIRAEADPSAEVMAKVIEAVCAANAISSKGDTETRTNKVKEIGEILISTPGLAEAMAKYMTPVVFDEAFQRYVDLAKPELKKAAERMDDSTRSYCLAAKNRFAETSGWLWSRGDTESVLEDIYRQTLCAEHVRKLAGASGYLDFDDALERLRNSVMDENKVPTEFWAKKHPALQRFFELLIRPSLSGQDVRALEEILAQQGETICEVFFDVVQKKQLIAMKEIFGRVWPATVAESRELYSSFPVYSDQTTEQSFKAQGRSKIEEYSRKLISNQVLALWCEKTGAKSPDEWSNKHALPAECVLAIDDARSIVDAIMDPGGVSAERLLYVLQTLDKEGAFSDTISARNRFMERVLPTRYKKIGFEVNELCNWLSQTLGNQPGSWLTHSNLHEVVEEFIKNEYNNSTRKQAAEKVRAFSDAQAKALLLDLIDKIPDVGLSVLE